MTSATEKKRARDRRQPEGANGREPAELPPHFPICPNSSALSNNRLRTHSPTDRRGMRRNFTAPHRKGVSAPSTQGPGARSRRRLGRTRWPLGRQPPALTAPLDNSSSAVLKGGGGSVTPTETNIHGHALCFMVKTWARHNTTEAVLNSGWRLMAVGGWRLVAVGGPWGLSLPKKRGGSQGQP